MQTASLPSHCSFPRRAAGSGGGQTAKDALGNDIKASEWLKTHQAFDRSLAQGLKGDPTYVVVTKEGALDNFGINAVCTHLGCVVPWNPVRTPRAPLRLPPRRIPRTAIHRVISSRSDGRKAGMGRKYNNFPELSRTFPGSDPPRALISPRTLPSTRQVDKQFQCPCHGSRYVLFFSGRCCVFLLPVP